MNQRETLKLDEEDLIEIRSNRLGGGNNILRKYGFDFLNSKPYSESELLKAIENSYILPEEFSDHEFEENVIFNLFKKSPKCLEAFYNSQPHVFPEKNAVLVNTTFTQILFSNSLLLTNENREDFLKLIVFFKNLTPHINYSKLRMEILLADESFIFKKALETNLLDMDITEDLTKDFYYMNMESLNCFLELRSDFYIEYGKYNSNLGFGQMFNPRDELVEQKINLLKQKFETHPEYDEKKWLWGILNTFDLQSKLITYEKFSPAAQKILTQMLEKYPDFFIKELHYKRDSHLENIKNFKDCLTLYGVVPLLNIYEQQQNEKIIKNTLKSKKSTSPSRF